MARPVTRIVVGDFENKRSMERSFRSVAGVADAGLGLGDGGIDEVEGALAMAALVGPRLEQLATRRLKGTERRLHVGLIGPRGARHGQAADDCAGDEIDGGSETMHANLQ